MSDNKLAVILQEQQVSASETKRLMDAFGLPLDRAGELLEQHKTIVVTDEADTKGMKAARDMRLELRKYRIEVEHKRKELKEDIIKSGRAIDSVATFVKQIIQPAEEYLELQEKYAEIKHKERVAKQRMQRLEKLSEFGVSPNYYNIDDMTNEQFNDLVAELDEAKKLREKKEAEAAAAAEAERKAEIERQRKISLENERLRAEADKAEIERKKAQAEADKKLAEERAKLQAAEEARQKLEKEKADREAAEAKKIEQERAAEAERKAEADRLEREKLLAPDKDKLIQLADAVDGFITDNGISLTTPEAMALLKSFKVANTQLTAKLRTKASEL